jgi:peptide/nickel transport system permease protein
VASAVGRFLIRRLGLAAMTLVLLSVVVFAAGQVLPGDPGRAILGNLANERSVRALDHQLGVDRPFLDQYRAWVSGLLHGDLGSSYATQGRIGPMVAHAVWNSVKLAAVALFICVPLAVGCGILSALRVGGRTDRVLSSLALAGLAIPEFVSGVVVILIFGVWFQVLPITATSPPGSNIAIEIEHLILPAIPLTIVLFGYFMRMSRAGMIDVLESDYVRTAALKGMSWPRVVGRHAVPNAMLPTITVIAVQIGYLVGGLVVIEYLFRYQGLGALIYTAASTKDFPTLEAGVLSAGAVFLLVTLAADILYMVLNPRLRIEGRK